MKKTIQYTTPTSIEEFQDFCKLNYHVEDEIFKPVLVDGWENFEISNYGRLYNTKTNKFKKCTATNKEISTYDINSIRYVIKIKINGKYVTLSSPICDLIMYTFYPDYADEYVNPIPRNGNIFDLSFGDNIIFVCNAYYKGNDEYREEWVWYNGEKTKYTIDTNGVLIDQEKDKIIRPNKSEATDQVDLFHRGLNIYTKKRMRLMAEVFIPNPDNLRCAALIDSSETRPSLDNICWTNRYKLVKK